MKRGEPPRRLTPLPRGKPPKRSALKRGGQTAGVGDPAPRRRPSRVRDSRLQQFHEATELRCKGLCEARCSPKCEGRARPVEAHHVVTRARGRGWPWLHDASRNAVACCRECHLWIHRNPRLATELALLASRPNDDRDPGPLLPRVESARQTVNKT